MEELWGEFIVIVAMFGLDTWRVLKPSPPRCRRPKDSCKIVGTFSEIPGKRAT
jgi:hypothetical protein